MPWEQNLARFACDVYVEGEEWPYDPRTILRRQLEKARAKGLELMIGLELEYFLLRSTEEGRIELADPLDTLDKPCYDLKGLTRNYQLLTVSRYVTHGAIPNDHEDAEQASSASSLMPTRSATGRSSSATWCTPSPTSVMLATFMPKPFSHLTGSGCHFHMSLWDEDTNLFLDENDRADKGCPTCVSVRRRAETAREGVRRDHRPHRELVYKRLKVGGNTASGAAWSPVAVYVSYGHNNRTQMLRVPAQVGSRTARSTARATRTWPLQLCSRPGSTVSEQARPGRAERRERVRRRR